MGKHCDWPKCGQPTACYYHLGAKTWDLCDYHGDLVQDEDQGTLKRARKKIGMPMPTVEPKPERSELPEPLVEEPTDFSDFETQLSSGDYDWDDT